MLGPTTAPCSATQVRAGRRTRSPASSLLLLRFLEMRTPNAIRVQRFTELLVTPPFVLKLEAHKLRACCSARQLVEHAFLLLMISTIAEGIVHPLHQSVTLT